MGRGPLWYFAKLCKFGIVAQTGLCCLFIARSRYGVDEFFEQHWRYATPVTTTGHSKWKSLLHIGGPHTLRPAELACLEAWERVMSFDLDERRVWSAFSPRVQLHDTLIFFDGLSELRDGWWFLSLFYSQSCPVMTEIRREEQDGTVFLHAKFQTEATARFVPLQYTFPSTVTLELDERSNICCVEHRWFGGPLVSKRTASVANVVGDVGDVARRFTGFFLSLAVTNSEMLTQQTS